MYISFEIDFKWFRSPCVFHYKLMKKIGLLLNSLPNFDQQTIKLLFFPIKNY